jgi:ATP phosphoribosyltransferase
MSRVPPAPCVLAAPRNRFLDDILDLLARVGLRPEAAIRQPGLRRYRFDTNERELDLVLARNTDIALLVGLGAVELGIVGSDVFMEQPHEDSLSAMDLGLGRCRLSLLALPEVAARGLADDRRPVRVATTYPRIAAAYFAALGHPVECIKLHGCVEIAPGLGLADYAIDLVSSGRTLAQNGLVEADSIMPISAHLIVHRSPNPGISPAAASWVLRFAERLELATAPTTAAELLERTLRERSRSWSARGLSRDGRPSPPNSGSPDVAVPASPLASELLRSGD